MRAAETNKLYIYNYPCRFSDMIQRFARPVSVLSLITYDIYEVMDLILI